MNVVNVNMTGVKRQKFMITVLRPKYIVKCQDVAQTCLYHFIIVLCIDPPALEKAFRLLLAQKRTMADQMISRWYTRAIQ